MSKKLRKLLEKFGVENIDEVIKEINADDDKEEVIDRLMDSAQKYAEPLLKSKFNAEFDSQRKALKGKYFKDAAQKANREFGSPLTSKEIDEIIADPANEGSTYDAVIKAVREKATEKSGKTDSELQNMLNAANLKISDLEKSIPEMKAKYENDLKEGISRVKLDSMLRKKLMEELPKHTSMNVAKAADLIISKISERTILKLNDDGSGIGLYDPKNPESPMKKNDRELHTLDGLIGDLAKEYELPVAKSPGGITKDEPGGGNKGKDDEEPAAPVKTARGLGAAFDQAAAKVA